MLYWIPYAFVRISASFIAGILIAIYFPARVSSWALASALIFLLLSYFAVTMFNRWRRKRSFNPGVIGLLAVFLAGHLNCTLHNLSYAANHISKAEGIPDYYRAIVLGQQQAKPNIIKEVVEVTDVRSSNGWTPAVGKVLLYLRLPDYPDGLRYGDVILVKATPQPVPAAQNPGEFDQRTFLSFKNISHQCFLREGELRIVDHAPPSLFIGLSLRARSWAEEQISNVVHGTREQAIATALVLGITDGLDNELMGAYAATGAMHVLSVSGLHVGILYLLLMIFLKPVEKVRAGRWIVAALVLTMLWMYAYVTGLSPSVLRAVTMFSFIVIAKPLGQRTNIFNVLAASAFLILLFDPFLVMSVGFQLSYLAVAGIVYLQPMLYALYEPSNRLLDEAWKVTSVSIAAQLATFPLGLLYFHQFPNYFLLSNLYVLPLGFVVLTIGLAVLAFCFIPPIASALGFVLEWSIKLLNKLIFLTEALPFSVVDGVNINATQCILIMATTLAIILFFQYRRTTFLVGAVGSITVVTLLSLADLYGSTSTPRLVVYKVSRSSAYDLMEGGRAIFFADSTLMNDTGKVRFHLAPNRLLNYCDKVVQGKNQRFSSEFPFGRLTVWNGKTILQLTAKVQSLPKNIRIDYLIISKNSVNDLDALCRTSECGQIIVDSSNSFKFAERLVNDAALTNRKVHSVWHHGAFNEVI
jgi:competence protein ComEC